VGELSVQETAIGNDPHNKLMEPANPPLLTIESSASPLCPLLTVSVAGVNDAAKEGGITTPVPLSATTWGEPVALSAIVNEPAKLPAAVGVKVTAIAQLAPGVKVCPHAFDRPNELAFAPPTVMLIPVNVAVPGLESCTT